MNWTKDDDDDGGGDDAKEESPSSELISSNVLQTSVSFAVASRGVHPLALHHAYINGSLRFDVA